MHKSYHALHNTEDTQLRSTQTITQVQLLNIVAASKAHDFLCEADMLVTDVKSLFFDIGNFVTAARLKDIQGRLADEIKTVERLVAASKPGFVDQLKRANRYQADVY